MKRKIIVVLSAVLAVVIIMPLLLDKFIFGNGYKSNISNSDWASFLGAYIGSIIGAIATLVGIVITILYTGKQNKIDRQLQFSPYLAATFKKVNTPLNTNGGTIQAVINESGPLNLYACLSLKNVGLGPITYWKVKSSYYNPQDTNGTNAIEQGKCLNLGIEIAAYVGLVPGVKTKKENNWWSTEPKLDKMGYTDIPLTVFYKDVIGTTYSQDIKLQVDTYSYISEKGAGYISELKFKCIGLRQIEKNKWQDSIDI